MLSMHKALVLVLRIATTTNKNALPDVLTSYAYNPLIWEIETGRCRIQNEALPQKQNEKALELSPVHTDVFRKDIWVFGHRSGNREDNVMEDRAHSSRQVQTDLLSQVTVGTHHTHHLEFGPLASRNVRQWLSAV